jgi:hypothetical protein
MFEFSKQLSRRDALIGIGKVAAGAVVVSAGASGLTLAAKAKAVEFPWGYTKLNLQLVGETAYEGWYKKLCSYAVVSGVLAPLQKKIGEPFASLPLDAFVWGHGGAVGWGTLCGSLTGAGIATGFIAGQDGGKILNDVIAWYADTELPIFNPAQPNAEIRSVSQSDSPLCHVSVGKWLKGEGLKFFSPQRKERCARISADVAMRTVELLNDWVDGKYVPAHGSNVKENGITAQLNCSECHGDDVPTPKM